MAIKFSKIKMFSVIHKPTLILVIDTIQLTLLDEPIFLSDDV